MASNPLLKFREEILEKVIYPKIYGILFDKGNNLTTNKLWKEFREKHDCSVSLKEFKEWLVILELSQEQVTTWNIDMPVPNDVPQPTPTQQFNNTQFVPSEEDFNALFDNE